ncbi:MAG: hypothetical protein KH210_04075, partial [Roseburia sp.]|nr:hypothetical protein [Roseburia sp.]
CTTSSYPAPHTPNSTFLILACARPPLTRLRTRQNKKAACLATSSARQAAFSRYITFVILFNYIR